MQFGNVLVALTRVGHLQVHLQGLAREGVGRNHAEIQGRSWQTGRVCWGEFQAGMSWGLAPTGNPVLGSVTWEIVWAEEQASMIGQYFASFLNWQVFWVLGSRILGGIVRHLVSWHGVSEAPGQAPNPPCCVLCVLRSVSSAVLS